MKTMKARIVQLGGGAALIVALGMMAPRAAHAVAAALVQVTNTISNPVVTHSVTAMASQMVLLHTPFGASLAPGMEVAMVQFLPDTGTSASTYVVPGGQKLVVTEVDVVAFGAGAKVLLRTLTPGGDTASEVFLLPNTGSQQFRFSAGAVYPAGSSVYVENQAGGSTDVVVHGYLTSN